MPFVRKGLIEGVYGSSAWEVPPSEALHWQAKMEKIGVWLARRSLRKKHYLHFPLHSIGANHYHLFPRSDISMGVGRRTC